MKKPKKKRAAVLNENTPLKPGTELVWACPSESSEEKEVMTVLEDRGFWMLVDVDYGM